jgi:cytochrome c biogenesis protein CcdA
MWDNLTDPASHAAEGPDLTPIMKELLAILTPIALLNGMLILPSNIIGIVTALSSRKPDLTAGSYISGIFLPHFIFGLLLTIGLYTAFDQARDWMHEIWRDPNTLFVILQILIGAAMILFGYRLSHAGKQQSDYPSYRSMSPLKAFSVAAGLTIIKLPAAVPYFAAIDQILRAYPPVLGVLTALLFYNSVFLIPLVLIVMVRRLFGIQADRILSVVSDFFNRWGKRLMFIGLLGLGVILVLDAIGWFLGMPLLPAYKP